MAMNNGAPQESPKSRFAPVDVEGLLERWLQRLERFPEAPQANPEERANPEGAAPAALKEQPPAPRPGSPRVPDQPLKALEVHGELVRFPGDEMPYVIEHDGGRLLHRGTIAVRGPGALSPETYRSLGVSDAERAAFEFVAHWFGAPFDAVNSRTARTLSWGAWVFTGPALADALLLFKARSPLAFEELLGKLGIDAVDDGGLQLVVRGARGSLLRGAAAEQVVASDPRRVAALARAARDPDARAAQVANAFERSLRPALGRAVPARSSLDQARRLGELATSPRGLAVVFFAALRGQRAVSLLAQSAAQGWEAGIEAWLSALAGAGDRQTVLHVRRILAAPELDMS